MITHSPGMPAGPCTTSRTVALPAISSASPSPSPSPSSFGATVLFMLAQTSTTSEWVRASVTARLAATTLPAGPGVAPATNTTWFPSPSAAATPWARSVNACPVFDRGEAMETSLPNDPVGRFSRTGRSSTRSACTALWIRLSRRSTRNATIRPMSNPSTRPLGMISSFLGLLGLPGGVATLLTDPPLVFASSPLVVAYSWVSLLSLLLSESSWAVSAARCGEFDGRVPILVLSAAMAALSAVTCVCSVLSCALT